MKIAQVLMAQSLYITDLDEKKTKRVSNQGRMMIANPNTVAKTVTNTVTITNTPPPLPSSGITLLF